jgi:hypothetical protein
MQVQGDVDVNINACRGEVWAFLTDPHAVGRCAPGRRLNKTRPMVLLTDISGSMEARTQLLLMAAYGLARGYGAPFEAFVFGTPLTRIARPLMTLRWTGCWTVWLVKGGIGPGEPELVTRFMPSTINGRGAWTVAALPFVDDSRPAYNLASVDVLASHPTGLVRRRPVGGGTSCLTRSVEGG